MINKVSFLKRSLITVILIFGISCDDNSQLDEKMPYVENFISANDAINLLKDISNISSPSSKNGRMANMLAHQVESVKTLNDELETPLFHIINYEKGGFVIFSADNRAKPILAYSESSNFPLDIETYPTVLLDWLTFSKEYIQNIRKEGKEQTEAQAQQLVPCEMASTMLVEPGDDCGGGGGGGGGGCQNEYEEVGPLIQTEWGQGCGYNNLTPVCNNPSYCNRTPTGCVATAMAQVMRYHSYPATYNWTIMPDVVWSSSNTGSPEISQLMRDIGNAVDMDYGCSSSSADTKDEVASSFKNDFDYSTASYIDYYETSNYTKVTSEIRANRPVIFRGGRRAGTWPIYWYTDGHAWVGDGFRDSFMWSEDCSMGWGYLYFHMNWGWDGSYNGWFGFNDFTPGSYTFNYKSGVVVNIKP